MLNKIRNSSFVKGLIKAYSIDMLPIKVGYYYRSIYNRIFINCLGVAPHLFMVTFGARGVEVAGSNPTDPKRGSYERFSNMLPRTIFFTQIKSNYDASEAVTASK